MRTFTNTDSATAWEQAAAYVAETAPSAYRLTELETVIDADIHGVWLDETTNTVWHAHADMDTHGHLSGQWLLEEEDATRAVDWIEDQCCLVLDALADPASHYGDGNRTPEDDLAVIEELDDVQLAAARHRALALGGAGNVPHIVDGMIRRRIDTARRDVARNADLRAYHVQRLVGTDRGGASRAANLLGITEGGVRKILAAAERRREQIITAGQTAKENQS